MIIVDCSEFAIYSSASELTELAINTGNVLLVATQKKRKHDGLLSEEEGWRSKEIIDHIEG